MDKPGTNEKGKIVWMIDLTELRLLITVTSGTVIIIIHTIKTRRNQSARSAAYNVGSVAMNVINGRRNERDERTPLT